MLEPDILKTMIAVLVPAAGVVVWLLRLEGRVNTNQALHDALKADVTYIRDRIDRALNGK